MRQRRPDCRRNVTDEAVKHGGHQGPLLLGQSLRGVEEEITPDRGETATTQWSRRRVTVR
jgi:hypothetical protein